MNTAQYSTLVQPPTAVTNPRARETARRRIAYAQIDAAYRARRINESARELAKWYVRSCCGVWNYHNLTQADQAQQYGVARRTIVTLVQQLVDADIIWLERHGSANRTYLMAYQAPPTDDVDVDDVPSTPPFDVAPPAYHQLRAAADAALAAGNTARAAMYEYQAAMELARLSNGDVAAFFGARNGDPAITNDVQSGSPSPFNQDSGISKGDTEWSVCTADGDDGDSAPLRNEDATPTIPDTAATRLLRSFGVVSPALLHRHAAAPPDLIRRAEARRAELGYSAGLIGRILDDHGVIWGRCGQRVENSPDAPESHAKYTTGALARYYVHLAPDDGLPNSEDPPPDSDPPPGATEPADDPALMMYRGYDLPQWSDGRGP
jgi:hypothetical protein